MIRDHLGNLIMRKSTPSSRRHKESVSVTIFFLRSPTPLHAYMILCLRAFVPARWEKHRLEGGVTLIPCAGNYYSRQGNLRELRRED